MAAAHRNLIYRDLIFQLRGLLAAWWASTVPLLQVLANGNSCGLEVRQYAT
jgi:hypothetical protein